MKHFLKHMQKNTAERLFELCIRLEPARLVKKQPGSTYNEFQPIFPSPLRRHMHQAPSVSTNCLPNALLLLTSLAVGILDYAVSPKLCRRVLVLREFRTWTSHQNINETKDMEIIRKFQQLVASLEMDGVTADRP
jgi:hypothetical protein